MTDRKVWQAAVLPLLMSSATALAALYLPEPIAVSHTLAFVCGGAWVFILLHRTA